MLILYTLMTDESENVHKIKFQANFVREISFLKIECYIMMSNLSRFIELATLEKVNLIFGILYFLRT